jgi:hypothetical protein
MKIPNEIRDELKAQLWMHADQIGWHFLTGVRKAKYYEEWTLREDVGGILARYMDRGSIRLYLKDTLLKEYSRTALSNPKRIFEVLGISASNSEIRKRFEKPHGLMLSDGKIFCWGRASEWKSILMSSYERVYLERNSSSFALIFLNSAGKFAQPATRDLIGSAAKKLGFDNVKWLEI